MRIVDFALSIVVHGGLAVILIFGIRSGVRPSRVSRPPIKIISRAKRAPSGITPASGGSVNLKPVPAVPAGETQSGTTKSAPKKRPRRRRRNRSRNTSPPSRDQPVQAQPSRVKPAGADTTTPRFGLTLEGATRSSKSGGLALPQGEGLDGDPTARREGGGKKKGPSTGQKKGFKGNYSKGELVPMAVVTAMPKVLKRPTPEFPESVREMGIEGEVVARLRINERGRVVSSRIVDGLHPLLDKEAVIAAKKTVFSPALVGGTPVSIEITFTFSFVLD